MSVWLKLASIGIAFSATIGIGLLVFSGRIVALASGLGAVICYLVASIIELGYGLPGGTSLVPFRCWLPP